MEQSKCLSANATDDVGVEKVEYSIDGGTPIEMGNVGDSICNGTWDTKFVSNGEHVITVRATDTSNNKGEASVTVTVSNVVTPPQEYTSHPM